MSAPSAHQAVAARSVKAETRTAHPVARGTRGACDVVNYRVADRDLKYYIFDWDDNILRMPTRIHLERRTAEGGWEPHAVSTTVFALVRNDTVNVRPPDGDWEKAFVEFRDLDHPGGPSRFMRDTEAAIDAVMTGREAPPPSFQRFRRTLIEGRLFAIVTARGHRPTTIRRGVEYFIERVLTARERAEMVRNLRGYLDCFENRAHDMSDAEVLAYYLGFNQYHPVTSAEFKSRISRQGVGWSPERAKQLAIRDFVHHVLGILRRSGLSRPVSVGFSDDDPGNVRAVEDYFRRELAREFPGINFVVYDTSDPSIPSGRKVTVSGQLKLPLDAPAGGAALG